MWRGLRAPSRREERPGAVSLGSAYCTLGGWRWAFIGNCHAGPNNPQFIEVTKDKKVVWSFKDFKNFGNSMPVQAVLGAK